MYKMVKSKESISLSLDKVIIEKIENESSQQNRSKSFIANKHLQDGME